MKHLAYSVCGALIGTAAGVALFWLRFATGAYDNNAYYDGVGVVFGQMIGFPVFGALFGAMMVCWTAEFIRRIREQDHQ